MVEYPGVNRQVGRQRAWLGESVVALTLMFMAIGSASAQFSDQYTVDLGNAGHDFAYDAVRELIYVSIPDQNELAVVSTVSRRVVDRIFVGSRPRGVDLTNDGSSVYVALNQAGSVARVNTETLAREEIFVAPSLGHSLAWDVVEARQDRVFVSANPGSGGISYIAMIKTDQADTVSRVAGNRIIRAAPAFLESPTQDRLYVGEGFSPNSLYALDITGDSAPIVLEDQHGQVSGTQISDISADGTRIFLASGQVLRHDSFWQAGAFGNSGKRLST